MYTSLITATKLYCVHIYMKAHWLTAQYIFKLDNDLGQLAHWNLVLQESHCLQLAEDSVVGLWVLYLQDDVVLL